MVKITCVCVFSKTRLLIKPIHNVNGRFLGLIKTTERKILTSRLLCQAN